MEELPDAGGSGGDDGGGPPPAMIPDQQPAAAGAAGDETQSPTYSDLADFVCFDDEPAEDPPSDGEAAAAEGIDGAGPEDAEDDAEDEEAAARQASAVRWRGLALPSYAGKASAGQKKQERDPASAPVRLLLAGATASRAAPLREPA